MRGHFQGYPKKLGSIWQTRPVTIGKAGPRIAPGGRFAGTVSYHDRRIVDMRVTLREESETNGFVNGHAMIHSRYMPRIENDGTDSYSELVTMSELHGSPVEEVARLEVREVLGAYFRSVGTTFAGGTTLESLTHPEVQS